MEQKKLFVIGTVYVDIKGYPLGHFMPTGRNAGRVEQFQGGVGRNIAEDIANLGDGVALVSLVDEGGMGEDVIKHLQAQGVDTDYIRATKDGMGTWLAIFDNAGEVCANISKRPNLLPIADILREKEEQIAEQAAGFLLEIDVDEAIVEETFRIAEKYGLKVYSVISNMSIAKERLPYIEKSACFICNRQEAGILFEAETEKLSQEAMLQLLVDKLEDMALKRMVVTMDAAGAVFASKLGEHGVCPARKVEVVDTTGAGDSFFAGVSVALNQGKQLQEACELGTSMAAKVIGVNGNVYLP